MTPFGQGQVVRLIRHRWRACCLSATRSIVVMLVIFIAALGTGCSTCRLPAIDPTGSSFFLPYPNSTSVVSPHEGTRSSIFPQPAFETPATPPPCVQGMEPGCGGPATASSYDTVGTGVGNRPGERGQIMMTPLRVVAPVGGEVVLLAGICGPDGYLVTRQPLEWMLSPDSVGQIIEVGDDAKGKTLATYFTALHHDPKVEKLDVDFAKGRTSHKESLITRGTAARQDDLVLRKGQTWVSLTSPTPGTSYLTALAPDSQIWNRRRVTATVHWVEGHWQFPDPQDRADREPAQLRTVVNISEGVPAPGWKVRYRSLNPNVALFSTGAEVAEVRTDDNGVAVAQLVQNNGATGTAMVAMEVITPANAAMKTPELVLGRGQTVVTWVAPRINMNVQGPTEAGEGEVLNYTVFVSNPGQLAASNVRVVMRLPTGMEYIDATPSPTTPANSGAIWEVGPLEAGREFVANVRLRSNASGSFRIAFEATGDPNLSTGGEYSTVVIAPTVDLQVRAANNVQQVSVGERVLFEIDVRNVSNRPLTGVSLRADASPGFVEATERRGSVEKVLPVIEPGASVPVGIDFIAERAGEHSVQVTATVGGRTVGSQRVSISAVASAPTAGQLQGEVTPAEPYARRGSKLELSLRVTNMGGPLTGIRTFFESDGSVEPQGAAGPGYDVNATRANGRVTWQNDRWESGETKQFSVECVAARSGAGRIRFSIQTSENVSTQYEKPIQIDESLNNGSGAGVMPPTPPAAAGGVAGTGDLQVSIIEPGDPVAINQEARYRIAVVNAQRSVDQDIEIVVQLPQGVDFISMSSSFAQLRIERKDNDGTIRFEKIRTMRPGESIDLSLRVSPRVPQLMKITAAVRSAAMPQWRTSVVETTANNN